LGDVEIDIETWPFLPTYVEVEGATISKTISVCKRLGFDMNNALYCSVDEIYATYYDVTPKDVTMWPEIVFEKRPVGLIGKRIRRLK
jgi:adenylate cyclase class 2